MNDTFKATSMTSVEELRHLIKVANDLEASLRKHREALRQQGMSLPPGTLGGVQQIRTDMEALAVQIEDSETELQRLRALSNTTEVINSTLTLDDVLNSVMDTMIKLTAAERGYLMLRNDRTGAMEFRVARNIEARALTEAEFMVSNTIVAEVARTGEPVVATNAAQDDRFRGQMSIVQNALRSILCVPLMVKSQVTGVVYADNRIKQGLFGEKEKNLLYAFANQAAIAIENARLYETLQATLDEIIAMRDLMENVFRSIASGVITADATDMVIRLNEAACHILNMTAESGLGKTLWEVLPPLEGDFNRLVTEVREHNVEQALEVNPVLPNRGQVNWSVKLSPLRESGKVTRGLAIAVDDLTEIKQREAQLNVIRPYLPPAMVDNIESIDKLGLGGERRLVTTVFIDVRGFTTFPSSLRPQELMEMLNRYLTVASDALIQQNGVLDKYMANEIMGLFNTQLNPSEDHAWRAVLSALNMADEYCAFYKQSGEPEGKRYYRVGIHTGVATLGNAGSESRKEFTAIGDSVNVAHRLLENAQLGQIIISDDTYQQSWQMLANPQSGIKLIPHEEPIQVKGRKQTVRVYEVARRPA